ncbi:MAG: hypothetical protein B7Z12_22230 [Caulobacter vibrioides]|uniref:Non-reducing end beta-L-arabinofuranosidase-like GH127 middle domain-containing protein n=1 Tax=Caulobacter vibrioides TaxID=155892 RepID=A0A258CNI5_CAUVI|nr:MAG: hypothetical protein B7Z12_22230 [Caulobacter vibrioides]
METHAKHGESIWWHDSDTLFVNLFIPSTAEWRERGMKVALDTRYPFDEQVAVTIAQPPRATTTIALRLPGWCAAPALRLNGAAVPIVRDGGYARITRRWKAGDRLELDLPMAVRVEPTPDDPRTIAYLHGPLVLAADLGPAAEPFEGPVPALVTGDPAAALAPENTAEHRFRLADARPAALTLVPFFRQYDRRTAVYFPGAVRADAAPGALLGRGSEQEFRRLGRGDADRQRTPRGATREALRQRRLSDPRGAHPRQGEGHRALRNNGDRRLRL